MTNCGWQCYDLWSLPEIHQKRKYGLLTSIPFIWSCHSLSLVLFDLFYEPRTFVAYFVICFLSRLKTSTPPVPASSIPHRPNYPAPQRIPNTHYSSFFNFLCTSMKINSRCCNFQGNVPVEYELKMPDLMTSSVERFAVIHS